MSFVKVALCDAGLGGEAPAYIHDDAWHHLIHEGLIHGFYALNDIAQIVSVRHKEAERLGVI